MNRLSLEWVCARIQHNIKESWLISLLNAQVFLMSIIFVIFMAAILGSLTQRTEGTSPKAMGHHRAWENALPRRGVFTYTVSCTQQHIGVTSQRQGLGLSVQFLSEQSRPEQGKRRQGSPKQSRSRPASQENAVMHRKRGPCTSKKHREPFFRASSCKGINVDHHLVHAQTHSSLGEFHGRY